MNWNFNNDGVIRATGVSAEYLFVSARNNIIRLGNSKKVVETIYSDYLMKKQVIAGNDYYGVYVDRNGDFYCFGSNAY